MKLPRSQNHPLTPGELYKVSDSHITSMRFFFDDVSFVRFPNESLVIFVALHNKELNVGFGLKKQLTLKVLHKNKIYYLISDYTNCEKV